MLWGQAEIAQYGEEAAARWPEVYPVRADLDGRRLPRRRVEAWIVSPTFPRPVDQLKAAGPVWMDDPIREWVDAHLARTDIQEGVTLGLAESKVRSVLADKGLMSQQAAAAKHGVSPSSVSRIWNGDRRTRTGREKPPIPSPPGRAKS